MTSFSSILDRPSNTIERPKPLPVGTYLGMVKGLPREDVSAQKKTPFVEFTIQLLQAADDVSVEDLQNALTSKNTGEVRALSTCMQKATFYLTEDSIWRLQKFLSDLGLEDEDASLRQLISSSPGCQVMVHLKHSASNDGESVYANIEKTARVSE